MPAVTRWYIPNSDAFGDRRPCCCQALDPIDRHNDNATVASPNFVSLAMTFNALGPIDYYKACRIPDLQRTYQFHGQVAVITRYTRT